MFKEINHSILFQQEGTAKTAPARYLRTTKNQVALNSMQRRILLKLLCAIIKSPVSTG